MSMIQALICLNYPYYYCIGISLHVICFAFTVQICNLYTFYHCIFNLIFHPSKEVIKRKLRLKMGLNFSVSEMSIQWAFSFFSINVLYIQSTS